MSINGVKGRLSSLPLATLVRLSGRSWWEVQMMGGRTIGEWQTTGGIELPLAQLGVRSRWEQLDHGKIVAARLWCPDGQIGEVQASGPYRIFQFKSGRRVALGLQGTQSVVDAHVLGVVDDLGACAGYEWTALGLGQFEHASVLTLHERYGQGAFNLEALGVRI